MLSEEIPDDLRGIDRLSPAVSAAVDGVKNHRGARAAIAPFFLRHLSILIETGRFVITAVARTPCGSPLRDRGIDHSIHHGRQVSILVAIVGNDRILRAMHAKDRYGPRG